jgi:hypothetical protein
MYIIVTGECYPNEIYMIFDSSRSPFPFTAIMSYGKENMKSSIFCNMNFLQFAESQLTLWRKQQAAIACCQLHAVMVQGKVSS